MSDQLPELTQEEKAALDSINMTEILGTPAERLRFALDKAMQFMRERNVARASEKMAWAEQGKMQAMLDERTLQHQTQLQNAIRLEEERDRWKSEHLRLTNELESLQQLDCEREKVAKQFLELEKKFETEADLRVHWQTRCCKVLDELRNQRDMIESYVRELEKARGLLRETFVDPAPTCEHTGNEQNQFAYFHLSVWESLKARCQALLDGKEASDE